MREAKGKRDRVKQKERHIRRWISQVFESAVQRILQSEIRVRARHHVCVSGGGGEVDVRENDKGEGDITHADRGKRVTTEMRSKI